MVKHKIKIITVIFALLALFFHGSTGVYSMSEDQINSEIKQLNEQIQSNKDKMQGIEAQKREYAANIAAAREQSATLQGEMSILDNRIAAAQMEMESTQNQIDQSSLELKKITFDVQTKKAAIEKEKSDIALTLKLIYRQNDASVLEVLLMNDSLSEFLDRARYLDDVNRGMGESLDALKTDEAALQKALLSLDQKNKDLQTLQQSLVQNKLALESDKLDKAGMLAETQDSESRYQGLVSELKRQQDQANSEISNLEKNVRDKLASLDKNKIALNPDGLIWPVPKNYITTYFHDPDYPFRYLFEHSAIDIRAGQGTTIVAADSGYVAHAKMNGNAYAYVMIIHGNGLSTVYGHVSKLLVSEDDYVVQGQVIASSGGTPGTKGSGPFTTGPHLHFEVRQDGVPVNPLEYLQ